MDNQDAIDIHNIFELETDLSQSQETSPTHPLENLNATSKKTCCSTSTSTTDVMAGSLPSISNYESSTPTHIHTVVCNSPSCTTDGVINAQEYAQNIIKSHRLAREDQTSPIQDKRSCPTQAARELPETTTSHSLTREVYTLMSDLYREVFDMVKEVRQENSDLLKDVAYLYHKINQIQDLKVHVDSSSADMPYSSRHSQDQLNTGTMPSVPQPTGSRPSNGYASSQMHPTNTQQRLDPPTLSTEFAREYKHPFPQHQRDDLYSPSREPSVPPSQECHITTRIQQNKAFKQALNATTSTFNGSDAQEYLEWKRAFQLEVSDLKLNSTQLLQLLEARTEREPQQIIKSLRHVKTDIGHDYALQRAWKYLDKRYSTDHSPSQQLMSAILTGPTIKWTDTTALFNLSI